MCTIRSWVQILSSHNVSVMNVHDVSVIMTEASRSLHASGDTSSWYSIVVSWLLANDIDINNLPPLKYNHGIDQTLISHEDRNRMIVMIWQDSNP